MSFLLLRLGKIRLRPLRSACTAVEKGGFFCAEMFCCAKRITLKFQCVKKSL
jgi:hypothetical protein